MSANVYSMLFLVLTFILDWMIFSRFMLVLVSCLILSLTLT